MTNNAYFDQIKTAAARWGAKPFAISTDGAALTFADLELEVEKWARRLYAAGVRSGDPVLLVVDNRVEFPVLFYACQYLGATAAPFNPDLTLDSTSYLIDLIKPRLCVHGLLTGQDRVREALAAARIDTIELDDPSAPGLAAAPVAELLPTHPTQIVCTSGTSGRPKGAIQTAGLIQGMTGLAQRVGLTEHDRMLTSSPMFHGLGQSWFQYSLAIGSTVVIAPRFSAARFWDDCRTFGVTAMQHVGAILSFLLQKPPTESDRDHSVRFSFGVGASEPLWRAFQDRFGVQIAEFYGMTEIGLATFNDFGGRVGSVGTLSGGVEMRLVDDEGNDVGVDEPGEAWTRPINEFGKHPDYFREPDVTAAAVADGWFHTGDVLRRDADGWYWFISRKRDSLRRRGENLVADDIERAVVALDAVADCAAVAAPSDHGDDEVRLCLVLADFSVNPERDALIQLAKEISEALPAAMQASFFSFYEKLPYTATNKLQRAQLRADVAPVWDTRTHEWITQSESL